MARKTKQLTNNCPASILSIVKGIHKRRVNIDNFHTLHSPFLQSWEQYLTVRYYENAKENDSSVCKFCEIPSEKEREWRRKEKELAILETATQRGSKEKRVSNITES